MRTAMLYAFVLGANVICASADAYALLASFDANNFFDSFDFFTGPDPTHGFVEYVDRATAQQEGIIGVSNTSVVLGVDYDTIDPPRGRRSVRLTSKRSFTGGLFIADIIHMPGSRCGVWPALWMFGPRWPASGEIDIIEGVNTAAQNTVTLHTSPGCVMSNLGTLATTVFTTADCSTGNSKIGCQQLVADRRTYGDGFNSMNGGIYALEWTSEHIAVWFFPRCGIPADIGLGIPNPQLWGQPIARFAGSPGCRIDSYFSDNRLVFDTTFCGEWAGNPQTWDADHECGSQATTCDQYVARYPQAFKNAFWEVSSVKVYQ